MKFRGRKDFFIFAIILSLVFWLVIKIDLNDEDLDVTEEIYQNEIEFSIKEPKVIEEPRVIKGIYLTGWSAGSSGYQDYLFGLIDETNLNAVVIDIKDYSGSLSYSSDIKEVLNYGADKKMISDPIELIDRLHQRGIYVIGRITLFQDPILADRRPDVAIKSNRKISEGLSGKSVLWKDRKGLAWVDPASSDVWDYNISIAKEAISFGFDEINFDYIRFPSDGSLDDMVFPFWDKESSKSEVIRSFYSYLRKSLSDTVISVDLFGLSTVSQFDLGIGQIIEDAFPYFDFISPMAYPSHYDSGFLGFENPAQHPYEVVKYSMDSALIKLKETEIKSKIRPWLQDFSLETIYDKDMVSDQIRATEDSLGENYVGYMLWNPKNRYTKEVLKR